MHALILAACLAAPPVPLGTSTFGPVTLQDERILRVGVPGSSTWGVGSIDREGRVLMVWRTNGRTCYGQYWLNAGEMGGCYGDVEAVEFDSEGCIGGEVIQETISWK